MLTTTKGLQKFTNDLVIFVYFNRLCYCAKFETGFGEYVEDEPVP